MVCDLLLTCGSVTGHWGRCLAPKVGLLSKASLVLSDQVRNCVEEMNQREGRSCPSYFRAISTIHNESSIHKRADAGTGIGGLLLKAFSLNKLD